MVELLGEETEGIQRSSPKWERQTPSIEKKKQVGRMYLMRRGERKRGNESTNASRVLGMMAIPICNEEMPFLYQVPKGFGMRKAIERKREEGGEG
jgi:hypothetical protein